MDRRGFVQRVLGSAAALLLPWKWRSAWSTKTIRLRVATADVTFWQFFKQFSTLNSQPFFGKAPGTVEFLTFSFEPTPCGQWCDVLMEFGPPRCPTAYRICNSAGREIAVIDGVYEKTDFNDLLALGKAHG